MISEGTMIWVFGTALVPLGIGSVLYSMGGYKGKWKRRFVGASILAGGYNGICAWMSVWNPWLLTALPALIGTFCLPYGADTLFPKIVKRTAVVVACVGSGLAFCLTHGGNAWFVFIPHVGIGLWSVYLGTKNPIYARAEEGFICILLCLGLYMYPFTVLS